MHLSFIQYSALIFAGLFSGIVDTIAGGGGMITVPALLSVGVPPATSLGTNRLQSTIGEITAMLRFSLRGHIQLRHMLLGLTFAALGATIGTIVIQIIHPTHLKQIIAVLILLVLLYFTFAPHLKDNQPSARISAKLFYLTIGTAIGFYNGFFGPGTGTLWVVGLMFFLGYNMKQAVMHMKPLNFIGNVASLFIFMLGGHVAYVLAFIMGAGQIIGANIGAHLVMHKSIRLIRPLFIIIVSIMTINLLWEAFF